MVFTRHKGYATIAWKQAMDILKSFVLDGTE